MSLGYKAVAKFTKTLLIDAESLPGCGRRLRAACAADFCDAGRAGESSPSMLRAQTEALPSTILAAMISVSSWPAAPNLHNDDENQAKGQKSVVP